MKKIMSKVISAIILAAAVLSPGLSGPVCGASFAGPGTMASGNPVVPNTYAVSGFEAYREYTIGELQEIAVGNSRQALVDDVEIKKKEMAVRTVRSDINAMSDSILSVTKPMDVKLELEVAKRTRQDRLNQLKVDVYKACMNILLCSRKIEMREKKLSMAEKQLDMARARFDAAMVTRDDVDFTQYAVDSSKVDLANARDELDSLHLELKKLLNLELDASPIKIAGEIKQDDMIKADTDMILDRLYETETSVFRAAGKLEIARTAMGIAAKLYREGDLYYDNAVLDLEEAELDYSAAKTALEAKVKNAYNDMANRVDGLELAKKYTELTAKKLESVKIKYEKGTVSMEDYIKAEEALLDAELAGLSAIIEYNAARAVFVNISGET
jgi:hypothetical protein